jgi:peptidoglycan/LPS O-acetylase OafA/YrhL
MATHRADIDGLRAFAVIAVVFYHAGVAGFRWGFWGVDVFFVVSGFLITGILKRDLEAGRLSLSGFWARRMRRLVPAAGLAISATLLATVVVGSPLEWAIAGSDAAFSAGYALNLSLGLR